MFKNHYRIIKDCELAVSPIGLGTVKFGRNTDVKYPSAFTLPDDKAIIELLDIAKSLEINLIDTAPAYGLSEERIGQLLPERSKWVIATKVGEHYQNGVSHFDFSPDAITNSITQSLKRLKTSWLDIVLIHSNGEDMDILNQTETVNVLQRLKKQGLIRAIGLSGKTAEGGLAALQTFDMDIAMITHNQTYRDEQPVIDYAEKNHKQIFIKKAFASGHLLVDEQSPSLLEQMRFLLASPVSTLICGTINPKHLADNCRAAALALATQTGSLNQL